MRSASRLWRLIMVAAFVAIAVIAASACGPLRDHRQMDSLTRVAKAEESAIRVYGSGSQPDIQG
jgi:hypothetical protein